MRFLKTKVNGYAFCLDLTTVENIGEHERSGLCTINGYLEIQTPYEEVLKLWIDELTPGHPMEAKRLDLGVAVARVAEELINDKEYCQVWKDNIEVSIRQAWEYFERNVYTFNGPAKNFVTERGAQNFIDIFTMAFKTESDAND